MVSKDEILEVLKQVQDPEIGLDIVNLGLVYEVESDPATGFVAVRMTLTSPGCPVGPAIGNAAGNAIRACDGVRQVKVRIVWEPVWHRDMITPEGRARLGL